MDQWSTGHVRLLEQLGVAWVEAHSNVTKRCIGLCCPWCDDDSYHLGLFRDGLNFNCWKCGRTGTFFQLIQRLSGSSSSDVGGLIASAGLDFRQQTRERIQQALSERRARLSSEEAIPTCSWPTELKVVTEETIDQFPLVSQFLSQRGFSLKTAMFYGVHSSLLGVGKWAHRLVCPVVEQGRLLAIHGRDMSGRAVKKYINPGGSPVHQLLYNIDNALGVKVVVVEGVFDVWRLGNNTVATFGASMSDQQVERLFGLYGLREIVFAWDGDAFQQALRAARKFGGLMKVKVLRLPVGQDPDSLGQSYLNEMERAISWM